VDTELGDEPQRGRRSRAAKARRLTSPTHRRKDCLE
jgi:hypothetical protein